MTYEELSNKRIALYREYEKQKEQLETEYAQEHNPVKIGDIVTDHYHTIKVESMAICGYPIPFMKYFGPEVTKNGTPWKRQPREQRPVFQEYMKTINGNIYQYEDEI